MLVNGFAAEAGLFFVIIAGAFKRAGMLKAANWVLTNSSAKVLALGE